jgi:NtrC-family two-component system response regulator AlgB
VHILIVDDESNIRRTLRVALEAMGHAVEEASDSPQALGLVERQPFDVALLDLRLGRESGLDLLEPVLEVRSRLAVVLITAHASIDAAIEAMRRGAFDYLPKPFTPSRVRAVLERVERVRGLSNRVAELEDRVRAEVPEARLDGSDPLLRRVLD